MPMWTNGCAVVWSALLGVTTFAQAAGIEPLRIATTSLPPLTYENTLAAPGALYEVVEEMARRAQVPASIEFVPWMRAVYMTTSLPRMGIFPLTRSSERETQFRWVVRLYHEHFLFMTLKRSKTFDVAEPALSKERRIGILRGSVVIKVLRENGYRHIVEASSIDESVRFLKRGIVDAVFGDRTIYRAATNGRAEHDYAMSEPLRTTTTWLGGSLDFPDADAALLQKAMKEMQDDGSYARILKKYDLTPAP